MLCSFADAIPMERWTPALSRKAESTPNGVLTLTASIALLWAAHAAETATVAKPIAKSGVVDIAVYLVGLEGMEVASKVR